MRKIGFLFDLDGVIVDTAKYHYLAWTDLAQELSIPFTIQDNELLKGVSRMRSFEIILSLGNRTMSEEEKTAYCTKKNDVYLSYIDTLTKEDVLPAHGTFLWPPRPPALALRLAPPAKTPRASCRSWS